MLHPNAHAPPDYDAGSLLTISSESDVMFRLNIEYRRSFQGTSVASEPRLTFIADVDLRRVVDVEKPDVRKARAKQG
jgi:hypothetical protein